MSKAIAIFAGGLTELRQIAVRDDGTVFSREAVALMRPQPHRPVTFVAWRESTAMPEAPPAPPAAQAQR